MTDQNSTFKTVMRGYDPAEVDRRIEELSTAMTSLTQQRDGLAARVQELYDASSGGGEPPSYEHLGERVGQILSLADTEATELRERAQTEAEAHRSNVHADAAAVRDEADHYSLEDPERGRGRGRADRRGRPQGRRRAPRQCRARRVGPAAGGRGGLRGAACPGRQGGRRLRDHAGRTPEAAEDEFTQKMAESAGPARRRDPARRAHPHRCRAHPRRGEPRGSRLVEEARQEAARIVSDAKATAERVRADSERELTAASQRRDSINAQLSNVRQMLATLTGTAAMPLTAFGADEEDESDAAAASDDDDPADEDVDQDEADDQAQDVQADEGGADDVEQTRTARRRRRRPDPPRQYVDSPRGGR